MRPASGLSQPKRQLQDQGLSRARVPSMILVSPRGSWNEMPSSTGLLEGNLTFSKRMTGSPGDKTVGWGCSTGGARLDMISTGRSP